MDIRNSKNVTLNIGVNCPKCQTVNTINGKFDFDTNGNPTIIEALKGLTKTQLQSLLSVVNSTKDGDFSKREFIMNLSSLDHKVVKIITEELNKDTNFKLFILALIFYISIALNFKNSNSEVDNLVASQKIEIPLNKTLEKKISKNYSEADSAVAKARRAHRNHLRKK